ncbi:MAG: LysR family transcriptional regulator [Rhodospirillales bacterium]|nr:LysR family transcriptional regulator [Rhodospirillales bacterium]
MSKRPSPTPLQFHGVSLKQLRSFVALARAGSFSRAADAMSVSQPALSAAIRHVETQLGLRLFDRTTHQVAITDAGRALLPHAQRLLTTAENAFADMREVAALQTSRIRIGAMPSTVAAVAEALLKIKGEAGGVAAHLSDGKSDDLNDGLHNGAFDLIVNAAPTHEPDIEATLLFEDELIMVARHDHTLADRPRLPWRALAGTEIVHFPGGSIGALAAGALQQNGLAHSNRFQVDQLDSLHGIVRSGLAVGILPRLYSRMFASDQFAFVQLDRPTVKRRVKLLHRARLADEHPAAAKFGVRLAAELRGTLSDRAT